MPVGCTHPHPFSCILQQTPRKCEETNQMADGKKVLKDIRGISTSNESASCLKNHAAFLSLPRGIHAGSLLFALSPPCPGGRSWNSLGMMRTLRGAIRSPSPFLPWKSTPISPTELPPFVSTGSENPNLGASSLPAWTPWGACLASVWEPGKLAPVSSSILNLLGNHFGISRSSQILSLFSVARTQLRGTSMRACQGIKKWLLLKCLRMMTGGSWCLDLFSSISSRSHPRPHSFPPRKGKHS